MLRKPAFTLVELLVVIVIIGLLTSLATTSYLTAQRNSRDSARKIKVNSLSTAIESYYRVKQKFPGQNPVINPGTGTPYTPSTNYSNQTAGCEAFDASTGGFVYSYFPTSLDAGQVPPQQACNLRSSTTDGNYTFTPSDYKPYPNWIPGIGEYVNPTPVESRYLGQDGLETATYSLAQDPLTAVSGERTFVYRKLQGGYMIYALLENTQDRDAVVPHTFTDNPKFPNGTNITVVAGNTNVYLVRK